MTVKRLWELTYNGSKYCVDIVNQISAVRSALSSVGAMILKRHIENCVSDAIRTGDEGGRQTIEEAAETVEKYLTRWGGADLKLVEA